MRIVRRPPAPADATLLAEMVAAREDAPELRASVTLAHGGYRPHTIQQYDALFGAFVRWATEGGENPYGGEAVVARFFGSIEGRAERTLSNYRSAIAHGYVDRGLPDPTRGDLVARLLESMRRVAAPPSCDVRPISSVQYVALCTAHAGDARVDWRNRVLFGLGFEAALSNGEALALRVADVAIDERGVRLDVRAGREPRTVVVARRGTDDLVSAIEGWIAAAQIADGPLLRSLDRYGGVGPGMSANGLNKVLKGAVARVIGPAAAGVTYASLRAGHAVAAMRAGVSPLVVARYLGFNRPAVLAPYVRLADAQALDDRGQRQPTRR